MRGNRVERKIFFINVKTVMDIVSIVTGNAVPKRIDRTALLPDTNLKMSFIDCHALK